MAGTTIGADTGGTFTDVVDASGAIVKVPSTPHAPDRAVTDGIAALGSPGVAHLAHGTTVATNAVLEGALAPVALVTTEGLGDVIEIGRQDRVDLYDATARRPPPLVRREHRIEVAGRLDAHGHEVSPVDVSGLAIPDGVTAVAVCLLHADLDHAHEQIVAQHLRARGYDVVASHEVSPEFREYERSVTTVVNAGLRPSCRDYLRRLGGVAPDVSVMTSAGGLLDATTAGELPAALLLSGPAGGVRAAAADATACGYPDAVSFDMGGTSTDVCLIQDGHPAMATARHVGGYPVRFPSIDIHTVGAGGGSIARIDAGGALVVGPTSAGAQPGPACYGRGGTVPTVTDADLVAGRIPPDARFGDMTLDVVAARAALDGAGVSAEGVIEVVDATMARALRTVSIERGVDPAGLALVCFGGAGGLHACALADALGMPAVVVPPRAGVLSAVGLLASPPRRSVVHSRRFPADHSTLAEERRAAADEVRALLASAEVTVHVMLDCRYVGQSHELTVPDVAAFHIEHERRNGFARPDAPVEVVAVRGTAVGSPALTVDELPVPDHRVGVAGVQGPAVVAEPDATVWVASGWRADVGPLGSLVLTRESS